MKTLKDLNLEFKEVYYICRCGQENKTVILVADSYGFGDDSCKKCGKRNILELDNGLLMVKSSC